MRVRAFDWSLAPNSQSGGLFTAAVLKMDEDMDSKHAPSMLTPLNRNMHSFVAKTETAVLDLLTPPYNPMEGESSINNRR